MGVWGFFVILPQANIIDLGEAEYGHTLIGRDLDNTVYTGARNWESWPQRLYSPADFAGGIVTDAPVLMTIDDFRTVQYATHRLMLTLPAGKTYAVNVRSSDYAMRIFIGDTEIDSVGVPGNSRETAEPRVLEKIYTFTPQAETVTIIVQTSNFVHSKGGCQPPVITIGTLDNILSLIQKRTAFGFAIIGCLITAALYHLGLFLLNRRKKHTLLFSACCFLFMLMTKSPVLMFFPNYNFFFWIRAEYITHLAVFFLVTLFIHVLFPKLYNKWALRVFHGTIAVYSLIVFLNPYKKLPKSLYYKEITSK